MVKVEMESFGFILVYNSIYQFQKNKGRMERRKERGGKEGGREEGKEGEKKNFVSMLLMSQKISYEKYLMNMVSGIKILCF